MWRPLPARLLAALLVLVAAFAYPLRAVPGAAWDSPHAPRSQTHHHLPTGEPLPPAAEHGAHCLFCLTGAFAVAPEPSPQPLSLADGLTLTRSPVPRPAHGLPLRPKARAPPSALL